MDHIKRFYSTEGVVEELKKGRSASIVFLDVNMPGMGGIHVQEACKNRLFMRTSLSSFFPHHAT